MAAQRIAGICFFKVDGQQYPLRGSFKVQPFNTKKEGIAGQDGIHGYKETPIIPFIEGEVSDLGSFSLSQLQQVTNSTITAELANGKVYTLRNAWFVDAPDLDAVDGKITIKFEGRSCIEQTA